MFILLLNALIVKDLSLVAAVALVALLFSWRRIKAVILKNGDVRAPIANEKGARDKDVAAIKSAVAKVNADYDEKGWVTNEAPRKKVSKKEKRRRKREKTIKQINKRDKNK